MSPSGQGRRQKAPRRPAEERCRRLSESLGIGLPVFVGPLTAFRQGIHTHPGDPVYIGGDLHATHPDASPRHRGAPYDPALESARILISDEENPSVEATAREGVWCLAIDGAMLDSAPTFTLWDSGARLREWLFLPPARSMIGIAHLWLPSIAPAPERPDNRDPRPPLPGT